VARQIAVMSAQDRSANLAIMAGDLRAELNLFDESALTMFNDQRVCDARRFIQRKLDRVYKRANEFGLHAG